MVTTVGCIQGTVTRPNSIPQHGPRVVTMGRLGYKKGGWMGEKNSWSLSLDGLNSKELLPQDGDQANESNEVQVQAQSR